MRFDDLTEYLYATRFRLPGVLNVGWLCRQSEFPKGIASPSVLRALRMCLRLASVNRVRGWHECELCWASDAETHQIGSVSLPGTGLRQTTVDDVGSRVFLGAAEIWLPAPAGGIFAAPDLLLHYVEQHDYLPPLGFVEAALAFRPGSWDAERIFDERTAMSGPAAPR